MKPGSENDIAPKYGNVGWSLVPYGKHKEIYAKFSEGKNREQRDKYFFFFRKLKEKEESDKVNDYLFSPSKGIIFRRQDNREFEIVEDSYLVRVNCRTKELENGTVVGKQVCPDCESFIGPYPYWTSVFHAIVSCN
ncbi:MAG: hypothetical protein IPL26_21490 [Leptospiraceae bacterium]|nr:hypothetical protein [Leptospiraceae bacterium]